jgi:PH domain
MVVPPQPPATYFPSDTSTATDDNTAPSSAANTTERGMMHHDDDDDHDAQGTILRHNNNNNNNNGLPGRSRSVTRFIDNTRRRLSRKDGDSDDDEGGDPQGGSLIAGYLQKLGRNGKWQTRWFETDGECLSYYKSAKRTKLLATLDLQKVICNNFVQISFGFLPSFMLTTYLI